MADSFLASFNGVGTLVGYVPEIGDAVSAPANIDFDDGNDFAAVPNTGLEALVLANDGTARLNPAEGSLVVLKLPSSPTDDYFVEIEFDIFPFGSFGDFYASFDVLMCLRASEMTSGWTYGKNFIGGRLSAAEVARAYSYYARQGNSGGGLQWTDPGDYSAGTHTFTFRTEIIGSTRNLKVNGALVYTDDVTALITAYPAFALAGDTYIALLFSTDGPTLSGIGHPDLEDTPIRRIRMGSLPEGANVFWRDFVRSYEVDA